jgi:hypothetical protein
MASINDILWGRFAKKSKNDIQYEEPAFEWGCGFDLSNENQPNENQRNSVIFDQSDVFYPCDYQSYKPEGKAACIFICMTAIHNLFRHEFDKAKIAWQRVIDIGIDLKVEWCRKEKQQIFSCVSIDKALKYMKEKTKKKWANPLSAQGYLTWYHSPPEKNELDYNFQCAIAEILSEDGTCAIFQVRDHATVIYRNSGFYTIFDSHGSPKLNVLRKAFYKTVFDIESLEAFVISLYWIDSKYKDDNYFSLDKITIE